MSAEGLGHRRLKGAHAPILPYLASPGQRGGAGLRYDIAMTSRATRVLRIAALAAALALSASLVHAQLWSGGYGDFPPRFATKTTFRGEFNFCRLMFQSNRREKRGWGTDYPGADINFSIRLAELTKTRVSMTDASEGGEPDHVVVRATDEALFQCPFVLVEDGGGAHFNDQEVIQLREYLLKGGFMFASDYWGTRAGQQWEREIGRVLPPSRYPIADLTMDHPIWRTQFEVKKVPQMPSIQSWRRTGGGISERGYDSEVVHARGIADERGQLMVVMIHNSDIPDGWEREAEDPEYFYSFSPNAYSVGINIMMYAMTH